MRPLGSLVERMPFAPSSLLGFLLLSSSQEPWFDRRSFKTGQSRSRQASVKEAELKSIGSWSKSGNVLVDKK